MPTIEFVNESGRGSNVQPLPPFPKRQLLVLALCRICEPIAFTSIFPYIYHMVEGFKVTSDRKEISFYAGMVTSAFTFAEFLAGVLWGRLSDRIGRKPVLLTGLAGTALSVLIFGFSPTLTVAFLARALGGLLNGNIGVLQTTVAELVTVEDHQPRAYAVMPFVWSLGSVVGPVIGGTLAMPCVSYPQVFYPRTIWESYPYLLPNLVSAITAFCSLVIGVLFLEETHAIRKNNRDRGLELGNRILSWAIWSSRTGAKTPEGDSTPLLGGHKGSRRYDVVHSPRLYIGPGNKGGKKAFTGPVVLNIVAYGILAFHTMTFDQLLPVFLSTEPPRTAAAMVLPFKFLGGLGLETKTIGFILSIQGIYSIFATVFLFPMAARNFGPLRLLGFLGLSYPLLYFATPYVVLLPQNFKMVGMYFIIIWKCTFSTIAYPSIAILLANSAGHHAVLGTINGAAASIASLCRAFGPVVSGFLYTIGLHTGYSGLAWWFSAGVTIIGAAVIAHIPEPIGSMNSMDDTLDDLT